MVDRNIPVLFVTYMPNNLIHSSKNNPCPVCNRVKDGDCRWYPDVNTVLCHSFTDGVGHDESIWHYNGLNDNPIWGNYVRKTEKEFVKPPRPKSEKSYYYPSRDGDNLVRVARKDDGSGKKSFYQNHWDGGKWLIGNPDHIKKLIPIYRYAEVQKAIALNQQIFVVEGETTADALWDLGIPATTTIGGSGGYSKYGKYQEDLKGARLILSPDRDTNGAKYISNFTRDFTTQIEGYCLAGAPGLWHNPQGGMDIADEIADYKYTKQQVLDRIISVDAFALATAPDPELIDHQTEELTRLLQKSDYDPTSALPSRLRDLIQAEATRWSSPSIVYVAPLLAVILSLAKVETRLQIRETIAKPVLWIGTVGTSNSGKSETNATIAAPLEALQTGANEEYTIAYTDYERKLETWEKAKKQKDGESGDKPKEPGCREFYMDDYTYESLAHVYQYQRDRCFVLKIDELKGFFDFEKYGTANNRSRTLSLYDGREMKVNRKSAKRIHIERTGISVIGTTQYTTLSRMMDKDDNKEDGLWARFVFINLPTTPTYSHDPDPNNLLYTMLAATYAKINSSHAQTYTACELAKDLWTAWYNEMVNLTIGQSGGFLGSIYGKAKDRVARIALSLHLLQAAVDGVDPELEISADTMHHAIELGKCLLLETEKCFGLVGATTDPDDERILKFVIDFSGKDYIDSRGVRNWWSTKPKPGVEITRPFMSKVVSLGYAIDNGEPADSAKYKIKILGKGSPSSPHPSKKHTEPGFELGLSSSPQKNETISDPLLSNGFSLGLLDSPRIESIDRPNSVDLPDDNVEINLGLSSSPRLKPSDNTITPFKAENHGLSSSPSSNPCLVKGTDSYGLLGLPFGDDDLENLKSIAESLAILTTLDSSESIEGLNEIYTIWTPDQMIEASNLLKTTNPTAFALLGDLVAKRNSR